MRVLISEATSWKEHFWLFLLLLYLLLFFVLCPFFELKLRSFILPLARSNGKISLQEDVESVGWNEVQGNRVFQLLGLCLWSSATLPTASPPVSCLSVAISVGEDRAVLPASSWMQYQGQAVPVKPSFSMGLQHACSTLEKLRCYNGKATVLRGDVTTSGVHFIGRFWVSGPGVGTESLINLTSPHAMILHHRRVVGPQSRKSLGKLDPHVHQINTHFSFVWDVKYGSYRGWLSC